MPGKNIVLVVGATGQLGTAVVRKLVERDEPVRALVRQSSSYQHLVGSDIDIVFGDLCDANSLDAACENIDTVIATANAAVPREKGDSFKTVDGQGYENLIAACKRNGVRRFIFVSVLTHPVYDRMPLPQQKRATEQLLQNSGLEYTIFRADAFMDVIFPLMGTELPLIGAEAATVKRPFWFSKRFFNSVKDNIDKKGEVGIVGDGTTRRTYICIDDVAEFLTRAVGHPQARNTVFDLGGPEAISQHDIVAILERVLGKKLKPKHTSAAVFKIGHTLLKPFSLAAANIMGVNYSAAIIESGIDMSRTANIFDVKLTSAEEFFRQKLEEPGKMG